MALNNTQHSTGVQPCPCHKALYNFREVRICTKNSDHDPGQDWTIKIILFSITILASSAYEKIIEINWNCAAFLWQWCSCFVLNYKYSLPVFFIVVEFDSLEAQTNRFRCYGYFYLFHFGFLLYSNNLCSPKYKKYADKCLLLLYKYVLLLRSRICFDSSCHCISCGCCVY